MTDIRPAFSADHRSEVSGLARTLWIDFPISLARFAPKIASAFTDGQHLLKWPAASGAAPLVAVAVGVAAEFFQSSEVFTTSWVVIITMAAVGLMSVQLGAWAFIGYVASDIFSGRVVGASGRSDLPEQVDWMAGFVSATVEYLLLALLVVGLPSLVLSGRLVLRQRGLHGSLGVVGERVIHIAMVAIGSWLWCQLVITSVRTVFTFGGWPEETPAVFTTQEQWPIITVSLAAVGVARFAIEALARHDQALSVAVETQQRLAPHLAVAGERLMPWRQMLAQTAMGVLLLGGLIDTWQQVVVTVAVYLYVAIARRIIAPTRLGAFISRVSILIRLGIALAISFVVLAQMTAVATQGPERGFLVPWLAVMLSLLIIGLATITAPPKDGESKSTPSGGSPEGVTPQRGPTARWAPTLPNTPRGITKRILAMVLFAAPVGIGLAGPASADNCAALTDCFTTQSALLVALGVLLIALAVVLVVATAPVSVPALAGGGLLFGGAAALTATELAALGAVVVGSTLIATQAPELIEDLSQRPVDDAPTIELDFNMAAASSGQPAINGEVWEVEIPKPPDPLDAEVENIAEHGWRRHSSEFPEIQSVEELEELVKETVEHAGEWGQRQSGDGSYIWYDEVTNTLVIKNPNGEGTIYRPRPGEDQ